MVALLLTGGLYAVANQATEAQSAEQDATQVLNGKKLFLEGCSSCHGTDAQGTNNGPTLIGVGAASVHFQVSTGRMPLANPGAQAPRNARDYSETDVAALAAYVAPGSWSRHPHG